MITQDMILGLLVIASLMLSMGVGLLWSQKNAQANTNMAYNQPIETESAAKALLGLVEQEAEAGTVVDTQTFSIVMANTVNDADKADDAVFMLDKVSGWLLLYKPAPGGGGKIKMEPVDKLDVNLLMEKAAKAAQ